MSKHVRRVRHVRLIKREPPTIILCQFRIHVLCDRVSRFYMVYLFPNQDHAKRWSDANYRPIRNKFEARCISYDRKYGDTGMLLFNVGDLSYGTISHECTHAALALSLFHGHKKVIDHKTDEEWACYVQGDLTDQTVHGFVQRGWKIASGKY